MNNFDFKNFIVIGLLFHYYYFHNYYFSNFIIIIFVIIITFLKIMQHTLFKYFFKINTSHGSLQTANVSDSLYENGQL